VKIRGEKLTTLARERGLTPEQLGGAVQRAGLKGDAATSAVKNWMVNRDHPRCKPGDVRRLAEVLGVAPKDLVRFTSEIRQYRGSPRKVKLIIDLIRGKKVDTALNLLSFNTKRAAVGVKKALNAAIADAEQNEADVTTLVVVESRVDDGLRMKRFQPKDRGRAHPIIKRFSNITVGVEERAAG
jgi:large subunit ribosomal protein L22